METCTFQFNQMESFLHLKSYGCQNVESPSCFIPSCFMFYMFVSFIHSLAELEFAVNDALMRYFDKCERFVKEVESNKSALEEVKHFNEGPEMKRVMEKMADRLEVPYASITDGQ